MNKELEEAIKELKDLSPSETAIETVLRELKRLQEENRTINEKILENTGIYQIAFKDGQNSVKDKIRGKIESLNKNKDMISGGYAISILEELLEGK